MKTLLILAFVLLLCSCCDPIRNNMSFPERLVSISHQIWFPDGSDCNSTAIGPHTLLTATHCLSPDDTTVYVDSRTNAVKVLQKEYDKKDHVIAILDDTFKRWTTISKTPVQLGDKVFIAGAPGDFNQLYRVGVYSGLSWLDRKTLMMMFQLPIFYGDSGSSIFNTKGEIITAITCNASLVGEHDYLGFACAYPLSFTKQQLKEIR